jgi:hypothetical protein
MYVCSPLEQLEVHEDTLEDTLEDTKQKQNNETNRS